MTSQAAGITINIFSAPVPITKISETLTPKRKAPAKKTLPRVSKKKVNGDVARGDALDIELMTRDYMADDEKIDLEQRVVLYIRDMLKAKKVSVVRAFLEKAKYHLDSELEENISNEISDLKKGF